ncbi:hypothetical protein KVR01_005391 [Diaporthe batatas]|uniref:serine/threonine protein kinase SCH9 n=1 Tax=Diaporthe batatas TaxID=748121 RepID=UPI001D04E655|nr:serine/threonine protein kinase SCH9 [Diaporthe batatas]KAG8165116.1 hypothetical protein KVR01_005391 [Diaporthe batatas]
MENQNPNERSRTAAADNEDGADQIYDAPRSGIATPQPDLQDKRLPGIMSYFTGQVRPASLQRLWSGTFSATTKAEAAPRDAPRQEEQREEAGAEAESGHDKQQHLTSSPPPPPPPSQLPVSPVDSSSRSPSEAQGPPLLPHETVGELSEEKPPPESAEFHPYPTPPTSSRSSVRGAKVGENCGEGSKQRAGSAVTPPHLHKTSISELTSMNGRRPSALVPVASVAITESNVNARHFSTPGSRRVSTSLNPPKHENPSPAKTDDVSEDPASVRQLKKLTSDVAQKSGHSTPTRTLSSTKVARNDGADERRTSDESSSATGTQTPPSSSAASNLPTVKGKLTIKISEARGLRKCRAPYVVAVFQRSELISSGPRMEENDDETAISNVAMGGVPIQRQSSDSGRPMAIPMRSRQSSNTSTGEPHSFRTRTQRQSFTNPKWDAEAVFDVVDSDMMVDISVYDQGVKGSEFLGHVDLQARRPDSKEPIRGWFALKGHADTMEEDAPTGELYVEALYQRTERRHVGPEDFQILRLIGKGTFGQVYQVRKKDTGRIYAMKVLSKKVIVQKKEVAHTVGERNILVRTATSESPFIVGLKFSFQTPSDLYLVTDYMSGGELFWHLQKEGRFDEKRAKFYIAELILAIEHLHKNDIVYRDLKPENILLDANGHIALCDFGLSKANLTKNDTTNTFCGTTEYLAPEVLLDEQGYTKMVDFWSLGVLVFEMCCGWSPFYAEDTQQMYKNIAFGKVRFPRDTLSLEGRNFVKGLLNRNAKHRLGANDDAEELKRHPFFNDVDWEALAKKVITPPFKPSLKSDTDVSYFDPEFTNALNTNGSLNERAAALARGFATSTPLSPSVQANFQGFTFVDESALDDHMRDRMHDDEMDVDRHRPTDWDEVDDINARKPNRMSGVVRSNDEHLVGGGDFDM